MYINHVLTYSGSSSGARVVARGTHTMYGPFTGIDTISLNNNFSGTFASLGARIVLRGNLLKDVHNCGAACIGVDPVLNYKMLIGARCLTSLNPGDILYYSSNLECRSYRKDARMSQVETPEYSFEYLWRCYTDNIYWKNFGGFEVWWMKHFLSRSDWKFQNFNEGYMPYNVAINRSYPAATAFCLNYIPALMEPLYDHQCEPVEMRPGQEPPEDGPEPSETHIYCEFIKVDELRNYLGREYKTFLSAMRANLFRITFNEDRTIVGFYRKLV